VERVKSVSKTGDLTGVASVVGNGTEMCALLTSTAVDCWGGGNGPLGTTLAGDSNSTPLQVQGVDGSPKLTGVAKLSPQGLVICAVLTSGGVDCWGSGPLGAGETNQNSVTPLPVAGVGGSKTLDGVAKVVGDGRTVCALLTSHHVDCWGDDNEGQLGAGTTPSGSQVAYVPQVVVGASGSGGLTGVVQLATSSDSFCAVLMSEHVDCWGDNHVAQLGNGEVSGPDSCDNACGFSPAAVISTSGKGSLAGVANSVSDSVDDVGGYGYYVVLASGGVDYWGGGTNEEGLLAKDSFGDSAKYSVPAHL
jgi:hypothetical protein